MTKRTRTILFLICLALFFLVAPTSIFYSQGYRFDFDSKRITQTGGLFLKVEPKQVEIYLTPLDSEHLTGRDGKFKKKTDFFFGSALIENLLPKKYKVEVKKEGYLPWEKNLEIKERQVTEVKNIVLFSENPTFNILTAGTPSGYPDFWFSPDEEKIILFEGSEMGWALKLYDLEKHVKSHLIGEKDIYPKGADLLNLEFSKDSKEIYLDVGMKEQEKNFVLNLEKVPPVLTEKEIAASSENIVISQNFNGESYYLDNFGHLFKNPSVAKGEDEDKAFIDYGEKLTEKPFPVKSETEYTLDIFQNFMFLGEGQNLYLFSPELKSFEKFFEGVRDLKISPDSKKLVYFSDSEIWILFLKDQNLPTTHRRGDKVLLLRLSEKINDVFWLNSDYLIFNTGDKIKIVEIDDRDRINIVDIAEFKNPQIFFSQTLKKLYILSEGTIYASVALF